MGFRVRRALLGVALVLAAAPFAAPPATASPAAIGGERLGTHELVVDPVAAPLPPVGAASFLVADLDTGAVLAGRDVHGPYAPASTLKTLTALTLLPRLDPALLVTPTREAVDVDGSKVGLVTQLQYPVSELFGALLIVSANDAAGALAQAAGGTAATASLMNEQAARLQARDTHAENPSGLDAPGQVSSAYDLALIARAGLARPDFRGYVTTRISSVGAPNGQRIEIDNHNRLLAGYPGAIGVKNGYTDLARASLVAAATRDGHTVVVTLMRSEPVVWADAAALLDWGFAAEAAGVAPVGRLVDPVPDVPVPSATTEPADAAPGGPGAAQPAAATGTGTSSRALPLPALAGGAALLLIALAGVVALRRRRT